MTPVLAALNQVATADARPPEWAGWLGLMTLCAVLGSLAWWLFASPAGEKINAVPPSRDVLRVPYRMALVVLLSFVLLRFGASWDELWHRAYGVPFGQDLLWPPHVLMYASFILNVAMVGFGLAVAFRGRGSLRARFRREPLLAMLGLLAAFGFAFIPVDVVWHQVIGPDLTAASPPHVVGALSGSALACAGVALALSTKATTRWSRLLERPRSADAVALGILAMLALNWLQLLTTEWEWGTTFAASRPAWLYPLTIGVIGATFSHVAVHATRRVGAATFVALVDLALHALAVAGFRVYLPPGPTIAAHVLLVPAAMALDVWYASALARSSHGQASRWTQITGAAIYAVVLLAALVPYARSFMAVPVFDPSAVLASIVTAVPAIVVVSLASAQLGRWLAVAGRPRTSIADAQPTSEASLPRATAAPVGQASR
jgi:hypothetical protein